MLLNHHLHMTKNKRSILWCGGYYMSTYGLFHVCTTQLNIQAHTKPFCTYKWNMAGGGGGGGV